MIKTIKNRMMVKYNYFNFTFSALNKIWIFIIYSGADSEY